MNRSRARRARRIAYAVRTRLYAYIPLHLLSDPYWRYTHIVLPHARTTARLAAALRKDPR